MIRALTLWIFVLTPVATVTGWLAAGPLVALALLIGLPLTGVAAVVLKLRRSPEAVAGLVRTRDQIQSGDS